MPWQLLEYSSWVVVTLAGFRIAQKLFVTGGRAFPFGAKRLDTLMTTGVRRGLNRVDFRLLLIESPRFPLAIQSGHGNFASLPAEVIEHVPPLLEEAIAFAQQIPDEKRRIGVISHRERGRRGKITVSATGNPDRPVNVKVKPWVEGAVIGGYRLTLTQASALAEAMNSYLTSVAHARRYAIDRQ
ncbi:MAG: hypothetical protein HKN24_08860 [Acidimicrobiales bacterium]|nr:hypothetical protein [Acidimicrobiales bacterium]